MVQTKTKVLLDAFIGRALVYVLNLAARLLGRILSIDHSLSRKPGSIIVCKYLGMGSIIQSTPLLQTLRDNFPESKLYYVTSSRNKAFLANVQFLDDVWTIDDSSFMRLSASTFKLLRRCWKEKISLYIDLETYSYFSTAIATMSCARNRFGFYRVERNIRMGVYTHMMFFNTRAPIAQSYLQMARLAGCSKTTGHLYPFPVRSEAALSSKEKIRAACGSAAEKYVVINPNASDLRIERRWPAASFADLTLRLAAAFPDHHFYYVGAPDETAYVQSVMSGLQHGKGTTIFDLSGKLSIDELIALIHGSRLVVTNDTGPMHISLALQRPTLCLFGPASPAQYGQHPSAYGMYTNLYCSPCVHDFLTPPCRGDNQCMKQITVEKVESACASLLRNDTFAPGSLNDLPMRYIHSDGKQSLGIVDRS